MKKIFTLTAAIIFSLNGFSQVVTFRNTYSNITITSVSQTTDHGYIIAAYSTAYGIGSKDIVLIKTDSTGAITWTRTFGNYVNANADDIPANAVEIPGGVGYYLAGQFWNQGNGSYEVYVLKTDANGNRLWSKTMYNGGYDKGMRVDNAAGGGCFVTGWLGNSSKGYLCKLDANGIIVWQNMINYLTNAWILQSGRPTPDGGMISGGYDNELGLYEMWLLKTSSSGAILWQRGLAMNATYNFCYDVCSTVDNGYMVAGGSSGINLAKTDGSGNLQWAKTYSGIGAYPRAYSVKQCQDTGFIVLANDISNNQYLMKTDTGGTVLWTMKYTGGYFINSVEQTTDGGFVLAMGSDVIKTDATGFTGCGETSFNLTDTTLALITRIPAAYNTSQFASNIAADSSTVPPVTVSYCVTTDIEEEVGNGIMIFPNPANKQLTIATAQIKINCVEIYDVLGERCILRALTPDSDFIGVVPSPSGEGSSARIDVSKLASGIYFVKVRGENGERVAKFVKE
jgi:hypothetical protein